MSLLCTVFPSLCSSMGPIGGKMVLAPMPPIMPPPRWGWLVRWAEVLSEAKDPPTLEELEVLATACLHAGYTECALEIATVVLRDPGAFPGRLDPLTQASFLLVSARSSAALDNVERAADMLNAITS